MTNIEDWQNKLYERSSHGGSVGRIVNSIPNPNLVDADILALKLFISERDLLRTMAEEKEAVEIISSIRKGCVSENKKFLANQDQKLDDEMKKRDKRIQIYEDSIKKLNAAKCNDFLFEIFGKNQNEQSLRRSFDEYLIKSNTAIRPSEEKEVLDLAKEITNRDSSNLKKIEEDFNQSKNKINNDCQRREKELEEIKRKISLSKFKEFLEKIYLQHD